jgi:hypothetical protein
VPPIAENTSIGFGSLFAAAILGITAGRMSLITVLQRHQYHKHLDTSGLPVSKKAEKLNEKNRTHRQHAGCSCGCWTHWFIP